MTVLGENSVVSRYFLRGFQSCSSRRLVANQNQKTMSSLLFNA